MQCRCDYEASEKIYCHICDKVFNNGQTKNCRRQPLKNLKEYGLVKADHTPSIFSKAVFQKFYLPNS